MKYFSFRFLPPALAVSIGLLAGCEAQDFSLYEYHRGKYPQDYKEQVKTAIVQGWPEPRRFRVLGITPPHEGFLIRDPRKPSVAKGKWGAWLGCVRLEAIPGRGAKFEILNAPYAIDFYGSYITLEEEADCNNAPYEPWRDMIDGEET